MEARVTQGWRIVPGELPADSPLRDMFKLVDELDRIATEALRGDPRGAHWTNLKYHWSLASISRWHNQSTLLTYAIKARLPMYVAERLEGADAGQLNDGDNSLLEHALWPQSDPRILELLLRKGADPNQGICHYDNKSPWRLLSDVDDREETLLKRKGLTPSIRDYTRSAGL